RADANAAIRQLRSGKEFRFRRQFQSIYIDEVPFASLDLIPLQSAILFACVRTVVQHQLMVTSAAPRTSLTGDRGSAITPSLLAIDSAKTTKRPIATVLGADGVSKLGLDIPAEMVI